MADYCAPLACHPDSPSGVVRGIGIRVSPPQGGALSIVFDVEGDIARVRVPQPAPARCADGLWRHTCFEAFVRAERGPAYCELNFAPSGQWALHAFRSYRDGGILQCDRGPSITMSATRSSLRLAAVVALDALPLPAAERLCLGLAAVIEEETGLHSWWALRHPPGRPDFHHPDTFALQVRADEVTR